MKTKCLKLIKTLNIDCHRKIMFSPLLKTKPKMIHGNTGYSDQ